MYSVSFALKRADVDALSNYLLRVRKRPIPWVSYRVLPVFLWLLAITILILQITLWRAGRFDGTFTSILFVILLVTLSFWHRIYLAISWKQNQRQPGFGKMVTIQLEEKGVRLQHFGGEALLLWSIFPKVERDENHLFMLLTRSSALIIPADAFPAKEQALHFSEFAQTQWQMAHPAPDTPPLASPV